MPSSSGTGETARSSVSSLAPRASPAHAPGAPPAEAGDPPATVLGAEREYLRRSRDYLRFMRENVLGLRAMGGDPVSEEYLKADLYRRAEALRDIPGAPLFFGRLDYAADKYGPGGRSQRRGARRRPGGAGGELPYRPSPRARPGRPPGRDRLARTGLPAVLPCQPGRADGPGAAPQIRVLRWRPHRLRGRGIPGRRRNAAGRAAASAGQPDPDRGDRTAAD